MATLAPDDTRTAIDDYDAITAVVQLYIDASATGDAAKMEQAFHPDAECSELWVSSAWKIVNKTFAHNGGTPPGV